MYSNINLPPPADNWVTNLSNVFKYKYKYKNIFKCISKIPICLPSLLTTR